MSGSFFRWIAVASAAALLLGGCAGASALPRPAATAPASVRQAYNGRVFDSVWSLVAERYYDPTDRGVDWQAARSQLRPMALAADDAESLYAVLTVMLSRLDDPHAYVQSPVEVERENEGEGVRPLFGMRIRRGPGGFVVDDVRPGGPADQAGVEVGWTVVSTDGRPYRLSDLRVTGRSERLIFRDTVGDTRVLTVAPRPVLFEPRRRVARLPDGVWMIGFDDFEPSSAQWLFGALASVPRGAPVVIDLRQNIGGRISEVERALGCFLEPGSLVASMRLRTGVGRASVVRADCNHRVSGPVAVLISRRSRSGAEMFAAAIQEWRRGVLVGGQSAGALLASLRYALPDGGRLTLSEADFVTGAGRRVDHVGVTPDVAVASTQADRRAGRDPELAAAVRLLTRQSASEALSAPAPETQP